jgi:hypothetical protein
MPPKPRAANSAEPIRWLRHGTRLVLLLLLVAAVIGAVILAGHWGLEQLRGRDRYYVPFADIECAPPAGMSRQDFLNEVRYESPALPSRLHLLDPDLPRRLQEGFAKHRWVESVESVQLIPPRQIVVKLVYRKK